jgi:hypothetical protein
VRIAGSVRIPSNTQSITSFILSTHQDCRRERHDCAEKILMAYLWPDHPVVFEIMVAMYDDGLLIQNDLGSHGH